MRKFVLVGLSVTVAIAVAAVAYAQYATPILTVTEFTVTPAKGGTTKKPKNAGLKTVFTVNKEAYVTLQRIDYTLPSKLKVDTTGFKPCSEAIIGAQGDDGCTAIKAPKVGTGAATALLGPGQTPLVFTANVYAAGKNQLVFALTNSLTGTVPIPATITKSGSSQVIGFNIPERVQQPVKGLYAYVTSVTANLGKGSGGKSSVKTGKGKKKKTRYFVARTGCASKADTIGVKTTYVSNRTSNGQAVAPPAPSTASKTTACKK